MGTSAFWKGVCQCSMSFGCGIRFICGDDKKVRFWLDTWIGNISLDSAYPNLFAVAMDKHASVFSQYYMVDGVRNWKIQFIRTIEAAIIPSVVDLICFLNYYQ